MWKTTVRQRNQIKEEPFLKKTLKTFFNIAWHILVAIAFCGFIVLPFLHNAIGKTLGQWIWYPSLAIFLVYSFIPNKKLKEQSKFVQISSSGGIWQLLFIISGIFVINYYDTSYNWYWFAFAIIAVSIPIGCITVKAWAESKNTYSTEQVKAANIRLGKYIMFYWLLDLFYMACFNQWLVLQFVFGGLAMLIVFYSLTVAFLSEIKTNKWLLLTDFILGIGLTVYLIYIIPSDDLRNIIIPIVSAVYGGLLTLVGVAWTIKDNNNKKRQDELNKAKPMFSLMTDFYVALNSVYPTIPFYIPNYSSLNDVRYISLFINSDTSSFYVKSVYAQSFGLLTPTTNNVVLKNQHFKIIINSDNAHEDKVVFLTLEDVFGRLFYYELQYTDLVKNTEQDFSLYRNLLSFKEISENDYLLQTNKENNQ